MYLEFTDSKEKPAMRFNLTHEELGRTFVKPVCEGKPFLFCGRLLVPTKVTKIVIFTSNEEASRLVLSNREEVSNHPDKKFVMDYILKGKVKGVHVCTEKFLPQTK